MVYGPTPSDVHVNRPLTGMSVAYATSDLSMFKADTIAPIMPVDFKSNTYYVLNKEYWFSDLMRKRGVGTPAIRVGYGVSTRSYLCELWSVGKPIDDQTRANEDSPLNSDRTAMQFVKRLERMNREMSFKRALWGTGKWSNDLTGNSSASDILGAGTFRQWDHADSTPIDDMDKMRVLGLKTTGLIFNSLSIGHEVWLALKNNKQILSRITGGASNKDPAEVTVALVQGLLGVQELNILSAVYNTAGHGQTMDGDFIFGKEFFFQYKDASIGEEVPTACKTITWRRYAGAKDGTRILKMRDENIHSDIIEIESTYDHAIIAPDLGIFGSTAIS